MSFIKLDKRTQITLEFILQSASCTPGIFSLFDLVCSCFLFK